ncbi:MULTISPECIES: hypothetical protein [Serratia]|uniref:hypothetical protein n=1 Tax=Serratia TaxID=613 RepID=UPI0018E22D49|nr:hypothetical protein [Serratia marcescens]
MSKFPDINLPVWMNKGEPLTLAHASKIWWERVYGWLTFPLAQIDVDTCDEQLLSLLAYQRDINRFPGESLALFRLRVKHAFVNALDAGSLAGFARIFERLEIGQVQQLERQLWLDWDVILLRINDEQLSRDNVLMMNLVRQYGRTCRRYFFDVLNQNTVSVRPGRFDLEAGYHSALYEPTFEIVRFHVNGWMSGTFEPVTSFTGATYVIEAQGAMGGVNWTVEGSAYVAPMSRNECRVVITGPGAVTVTGTDARDRCVVHAITPALWFVQDGSKGTITEVEIWASRVWGRIPVISELTFGTPMSGKDTQRGHMGSLWSEWGDMSAYGWPGKPAEGTILADWWITLSPSISSNRDVYMPILAGKNNREEEFSSNGTVVTVARTNTNALRRCAVWEDLPFQLVGFTVNGWDTPTFAPITSFAGATYRLRLLGQFGPVNWVITGPATITPDGVITISGPGAVSVTGTNWRGERVSHTITPKKFLIPTPDDVQLRQSEMPAFIESQGGRMCLAEDLIRWPAGSSRVREMGHLWGEWGDMTVYGWRAFWMGSTSEESRWVTDSPGYPSNFKLYVRLKTGINNSVSPWDPNKYSTVAVIDY